MQGVIFNKGINDNLNSNNVEEIFSDFKEISEVVFEVEVNHVVAVIFETTDNVRRIAMTRTDHLLVMVISAETTSADLCIGRISAIIISFSADKQKIADNLAHGLITHNEVVHSIGLHLRQHHKYRIFSNPRLLRQMNVQFI